ncbi:MAG: VacJ family lipoprotein [Sphingomonadaceae bacterium]|nr:VacJ family lipoprotein [Sphingomonadaceae bacterium]
MRRAAPLVSATAALALLGGCAHGGTPHPKTPGDPFENINRVMWDFDRGADRIVMRPATHVYRAVVPKPGRDGIANALGNVEEPFSAINGFLQGNPKRGLRSVGRFLINSTFGIGGLFDVATHWGVKKAPEDLGQTFAVWGVRKSAYLVLPLFGPSTVRDGIGTLAAQWADPYRLCLDRCSFVSDGVEWGITVLQFLSDRSQLMDSGADTLLDTSADSYAVARSAYLQRREAEINNDDDGAAAAAAAGGANVGGTGDDAALDAALKDIDTSNGTAPSGGGEAKKPAATATPQTMPASPDATAPDAGTGTPTAPSSPPSGPGTGQ